MKDLLLRNIYSLFTVVSILLVSIFSSEPVGETEVYVDSSQEPFVEEYSLPVVTQPSVSTEQDTVVEEFVVEETQTEEVTDEVEEVIEEVVEDKFYYNIPLRPELQDKVSYYLDAMNIDLDESHIYALIKCESSFDPNETGKSGDSGYCQILQKYFDYIYSNMCKDFPEFVAENDFEYDVYNEYTNLACGIYYLDKCAREMSGSGVTTENLTRALTAYNRGPDGAKLWFKKHGTYVTPYSSKVIETSHILQENGGL